MIFDVVSVGLVFAALIQAGLADGWRDLARALGFEFVGIVVLLYATDGLEPALVSLATGLGVVGIVSSEASTESLSPRAPPRTDAPRPPLLARWSHIRWFDVSILALVIVGAVEVAIARSVVGVDLPHSRAASIIFDSLILGGLLMNLNAGPRTQLPVIGQVADPARTAGSLLFVVSAGAFLLQVVEVPLLGFDLLLVAAAQLALAVAVTQVRLVERPATAVKPPEPFTPLEPASDAATDAEPDSSS